MNVSVKAETEPFVIINKNGKEFDNNTHEMSGINANVTSINDMSEMEMNEIYESVCFSWMILQLKRTIVPLIIALYLLISLIYVIPMIEFSNFISKYFFIGFVLALIAISYISFAKAAFSHPGRIPNQWKVWNGNLNNAPTHPIYSELTNSNFSEMIGNDSDLKERLFCQWCKAHRPLRSSHCSTCDVCVAFMDHHCEFMMNCIGAYNRRYFIQFICYLYFMLSIYIYYSYTTGCIGEHLFVKCLFFLGLPMWFWLPTLIVPQFKNMWLNRTYIEDKFHMNFGMYNRGSFYHNFQIVMGTRLIAWVLPLEWSKHDLKKRLIDNSYCYDLVDTDVLVSDAVHARNRVKKNTANRY